MNALLAYVYQSDDRLDGRVRSWAPPRWFRIWMRWASRLADGWLWLCVAAVLLAAGGPRLRVLAEGAIAASVTNVLLVVLKRRFRRPRPCDVCPHPLFSDVKPPDAFSFPSGHSMNACAVCTVLALHFPLLAPFLAVVAASVATSRVVLGMHYVSDVVAGSALGTLVGATTYVLLVG
jgi:undecaprenyl-diphosphatase